MIVSLFISVRNDGNHKVGEIIKVTRQPDVYDNFSLLHYLIVEVEVTKNQASRIRSIFKSRHFAGQLGGYDVDDVPIGHRRFLINKDDMIATHPGFVAGTDWEAVRSRDQIEQPLIGKTLTLDQIKAVIHDDDTDDIITNATMIEVADGSS